MLRSGREHLERLRDGRSVYIGNERVDDVTTHPAFARAAQEKGQWTAFAEFADDDAVMFVPETVNAKDWLRRQTNPAEAVRWRSSFRCTRSGSAGPSPAAGTGSRGSTSTTRSAASCTQSTTPNWRGR